MLMVGNRVLHNNAKKLIFFMFVYDYGHQEALIDSKASSLDKDAPYFIFYSSYRALPRCRKMS